MLVPSKLRCADTCRPSERASPTFLSFPETTIPQAIELRDGVYYPMGGFAKVAEGLESICRDLGVELRYDCPVEEVLCRIHG